MRPPASRSPSTGETAMYTGPPEPEWVRAPTVTGPTYDYLVRTDQVRAFPEPRVVLSLDEYSAELVRLVTPSTDEEHVGVRDSVGRVLAADVVSPVSIPVFDNSSMDGYAVRYDDISSTPTRLRVVGDVPAGSPDDPEAASGECVRIMTGAALPTFADTVVPVEQTQPEPDGRVTILDAGRRGLYVRRAGEDVSQGALVARAGQEVTPGLAGALAAIGATRVSVRPRPVVVVCATGDELVADGAELRRGQIYESNSIAVAATLERHGADVGTVALLGDDPQQLVDYLDGLRGTCDLIVLTGGASVGAYDVVRDVLTDRAGGVFRHVRVQPGKPQGWAVWNGTPVVSLPGNPVSAVLSVEAFVVPMLDRVLGRPARESFTARAGVDWSSPAGRRQLVPVRLLTEGGVLMAVPAHSGGSGSHLVTSLSEADGYAEVPEETTSVAAGDVLTVRWL